MALKQSPSQTAGPYVHIGCVPSFAGLSGMYEGQDLGAHPMAGEGERVQVDCVLLDGAGTPVGDAMVEVWQPDADGRFDTGGAHGWTRLPADAETGAIHIDTICPGALPGQAPHLMLWIVARGINLGLHTRIYFGDLDNSKDTVLAAAGDRAHTMIAARDGARYAHTIRLQGENETVFLNV
ncbi:protocatechuate 3,4-dioxygenase alpha subunit [Litoreibacter ponti]|uniref:Protocatechuate 3,4-dioxygenase alpha subunit n=1 Tax=Litoreibacter ponti TaxID=1510457 RepID=A0A2T6BDL9_9RHOB|nr:protocatechuate 3,4-dioxygenase subunit alpha [Litoreibacter ponti]PTX54165.1 protocatechuate 3,4-dioxygenase alpha subunit [Litoreibacter ponti]